MSGKKIPITAIKTFEVFSALSDADCLEVADMMRRSSYAKGEFIISSRSDDTDVFFVISGNVRANKISVDGDEVQFEDLGPGAMFGELSALQPAHRSNDCIVTSVSDIAKISAVKFNQCIDQYPDVRQAVLRRLTQLVRMHMQRIVELSNYSVPLRVRLELLRLASDSAEPGEGSGDIIVRNPLRQSDIAARINTRREGVTREINALQQRGVITWDRKVLLIHDLVKLTELSKNK